MIINKKQPKNWLGFIGKIRLTLKIKIVVKIILTWSIKRQESSILKPCWGWVQILLKHHKTSGIRKKQFQTKNNWEK